jgi:3-oxoacyl-[acyl-carrier-protein] synthase-3
MHFENVCIESLGYTLPQTRITSEQIEARLAPLYQRLRLPEGRLELMTGIRERRFWPTGTSIGDLSVVSGRMALQAAALSPRDVGLLVHGSVCRDHLEPATACRVHHGLGLPGECLVYDVSNACLGIMNGMLQAANMIERQQIRAAVVVGSENGRGLVDNTIRALNEDMALTRKSIKQSIASLTIGSASCAVLLTHASISKAGSRLTCAAAMANTAWHKLCQSLSDQAGGGMQPLMDTDSETLMREGIETGRRTFEQFLDRCGWTRADIDQTICHQVGGKHRKLMLEAIGTGEERDYSTFPLLGNTGSAALPVTLARAIQAERLQAGDRVALLGIGSGINCLVLGVEWQATRCAGSELDVPALETSPALPA